MLKNPGPQGKVRERRNHQNTEMSGQVFDADADSLKHDPHLGFACNMEVGDAVSSASPTVTEDVQVLDSVFHDDDVEPPTAE